MEEINTEQSIVYGRLSQACLSCDKKGCCSKCFVDTFQNLILKHRKNNELYLSFILKAAKEKLDIYEKLNNNGK